MASSNVKWHRLSTHAPYSTYSDYPILQIFFFSFLHSFLRWQEPGGYTHPICDRSISKIVSDRIFRKFENAFYYFRSCNTCTKGRVFFSCYLFVQTGYLVSRIYVFLFPRYIVFVIRTCSILRGTTTTSVVFGSSQQIFLLNLL